ncbi:MAG: SCO family protein, partial [Hyphomicrobiaceae bacterium]
MIQRWLGATLLGLSLTGFTGSALFAHGTEKHKVPSKPGVSASADKTPELPAGSAAALPFPSKIGGDFDLIDQTGARRRLKDFSGKPLLIFFGYARCEAICSVALPRMAETVDMLEAKGINVQPVLITVDPDRDTPEAMAEALPKHHERLVGLTGSRAAIDKAQAAFQVESKVVFTDPDGGKVFAHGSFIYLMGRDG